jgi:hypothetical protein
VKVPNSAGYSVLQALQFQGLSVGRMLPGELSIRHNSEARKNPGVHLKVQSVSHRKHITPPLQSPTGLGEAVAVYCENHEENIETLCGPNYKIL